MITAGADGYDCIDSADRNRDKRSYYRRSIAQLAITVISPTFHRPIRQRSATVLHAGSNGYGGIYSANRNRDRRRISSSITQLTIFIISPALHGSVREQGATVIISGSCPDG